MTCPDLDKRGFQKRVIPEASPVRFHTLAEGWLFGSIARVLEVPSAERNPWGLYEIQRSDKPAKVYRISGHDCEVY